MRAAGKRAGRERRLTPGPRGQLLVGTSGFSYAGWTPVFYPPDLPERDRLRHYATRFLACELNNTFYRRPTAAAIEAWLAATPADFRFAVKAQRGASLRAMAIDPAESVPWLTAPLRAFGDRLGAVLFRVPAGVGVDLDRLDALLAAWPPEQPLVAEFQDPGWRVDEVTARLRAVGAVLCATELPEDEAAPSLDVTGPFLYLRLRRHDYSAGQIEAWADRLVPFLDAGVDAFAFFRHDEIGRATGLASALETAVQRRTGEATGD